jgi:quercetin dioxygenase-like cupin family protein
MTRPVESAARAFVRGGDLGFELPTNAGVRVRPLLRTEDGHAIDVFFLTLDEHAAISGETHPYSETLVVTRGEVACAVDAAQVRVHAGEIWHVAADRWHEVRNVGAGMCEIAMLIGV